MLTSTIETNAAANITTDSPNCRLGVPHCHGYGNLILHIGKRESKNKSKNNQHKPLCVESEQSTLRKGSLACLDEFSGGL